MKKGCRTQKTLASLNTLGKDRMMDLLANYFTYQLTTTTTLSTLLSLYLSLCLFLVDCFFLVLLQFLGFEYLVQYRIDEAQRGKGPANNGTERREVVVPFAPLLFDHDAHGG
jgi:hypothetical protein